MRRVLLALMLVLAAAAPAPTAAAGDPPEHLPEHLIVETALLRMVDRPDLLGNASFGPSVVHPRPQGRTWAVVGQVLSATTTGNPHRQVYVAAMRLICDDIANPDCWRLEKLALDNRIVYDRGVAL